MVVCGIVKAVSAGQTRALCFLEDITFKPDFAPITAFIEKEIKKVYKTQIYRLGLSISVKEVEGFIDKEPLGDSGFAEEEIEQSRYKT